MEGLLDLFIFETDQNIEQLEKIILDHEQSSEFSDEAINEIFRIMHTIKGSAAMMMFSDISAVAHSIEDLFYFIREHRAEQLDGYGVSDLILESLDFIGERLAEIKLGSHEDGDASLIEAKILNCLTQLKDRYQAVAQDEESKDKEPNNDNDAPKVNKEPIDLEMSQSVTSMIPYRAQIFFEEGCQMESIRAFDLVNRVSSFSSNVSFIPSDITENDDGVIVIREQGFQIFFETDKSYEGIQELLESTIFVQNIVLEKVAKIDLQAEQDASLTTKDMPGIEKQIKEKPRKVAAPTTSNEMHNQPAATIINVQVSKLDKLMDLVGEMVISEAMVIQNPDLNGLELENFTKASRQLHKITTELQDTVMSIRMVPLADIFQKMHRIVRDMSKKLDKEVKLEIIGEQTEVDKNIIKHLSDPLMHLMRNSIDHGLEDPEERVAHNKPSVGTVVLEAKNAGNNVLVIVRDDGKGLNKKKILDKARRNNLLKKDEAEMSDKEVFNLIFMPGFSTNESVTEYSGRGVGMDVVARNIEEVGGSVSIDSTEGAGTAITIKIPLTLAIIDGMNLKVGDSCYTIPIISIRQSFRLHKEEIVADLDGNEMIVVRGQCFEIVRLHECFKVENAITEFSDGIFIMAEQDGKTVCLFADELLGQQQVVVKALPKYIKDTYSINGLAGCTLLGDGNISLILNIRWFVGLKG